MIKHRFYYDFEGQVMPPDRDGYCLVWLCEECAELLDLQEASTDSFLEDEGEVCWNCGDRSEQEEEEWQ